MALRPASSRCSVRESSLILCPRVPPSFHLPPPCAFGDASKGEMIAPVFRASGEWPRVWSPQMGARQTIPGPRVLSPKATWGHVSLDRIIGSSVPLSPPDSFFLTVKGDRTLIQTPTIYTALFEPVCSGRLRSGECIKNIMPRPRSLREQKRTCSKRL